MPSGDLHTPAGSGDQSKVSATPIDAVGREGWHGRYFEDFAAWPLWLMMVNTTAGSPAAPRS
jgi:hypothetical protein